LVAVSIDTDSPTKISGFLRKHLRSSGKLPFPILLDRGKRVSESFGTFKVPETFIIDGTGRIRDKVEGVRQWDDSLLVHYFELLSRSGGAEGAR
jgi:peroxiredoxin